jgi:hypothetical protein
MFMPRGYESSRIKEPETMTPSEKKLYRYADQIPQALWHDLVTRSPRQAAEAVGAMLKGEAFRVPLIGLEYTIDPVNRRIARTRQPDHRVGFQTGVVLLTTLAFSKGVPPSNRMVVPQDLPGGRMFFTGAHTLATGPLARAFEQDPDGFIDRAVALGGEMIAGADVAFRIAGLPYVPLYLLLWHGDQECAARAVIGIDDRAHFHLDLAGLFALTNVLSFRLNLDVRPRADLP